MLKLDAMDLYDLSEAGALLFKDPARLRREARLRKIPSAREGPNLGLPRPWVDAAAEITPVDEESLRRYWIERLAPASASAHRPRRPRERLPAEALIGPEEAARRLFAAPEALVRLNADGTVPSLRIDGEPCFDAALVDLVAREHEGSEVRAAAAARRAEVREWARFEYVTSAEAGSSVVLPTPEAASHQDDVGAFEVPADLELDAIAPLDEGPPPSTLIEADGFDTLDED